MTANVRCVLRYTNALGHGEEEVFAGRGCVLRAASRRNRLKKENGIARTAMVKQVKQPGGSWLDVKKTGYEGW